MFQKMCLLCLVYFTINCAGPATPFGGLDFEWRTVELIEKTKLGTAHFQIDFYPKMQNLHKTTDFEIHVKSPYILAEKDQLKVYYKKLDVTKSYMNSVTKILSDNKKSVTYKFSNLKLSSRKLHDIRFDYFHHESSMVKSKSYKPPVCKLKSEDQKIRHTEQFMPPKKYMEWIGNLSKSYNMNPSMMAALIAQESGFNKSAVSWSKAIGLTQVTPLADRQLASENKKWPRNIKSTEFTVPMIKAMIATGKLNSKNEWRLNPKMSIKGGIEYLKYLEDYWGTNENVKLRKDNNLDLTSIILASYNSGAYRVKRNIQSYKGNWLKSSELNEARNYVQKIKSYCYHFTQRKAVR